MVPPCSYDEENVALDPRLGIPGSMFDVFGSRNRSDQQKLFHRTI